MSEADLQTMVKALSEDDRADDALRLAVQRALTFLSACIAGTIDGASVSDRIQAAQVVLQHAASRPDVVAELLSAVSDQDVEAIVSAID